VPNQAVAKLVPAGVVDAAAMDELGASPIVNLHVHYDRRVLDEQFAAAVGNPVQFVFDRTASSGVDRGQLIAVSLSGADAEIGEPVATLRERYLPALERLLPAARGAAVLDFTVTREPRATFRAAPGSRRLRPGTRTSVPGLYLAGAWTDTGWPATMEGAVRSGLAAAQAAIGVEPAAEKRAAA
jgi:monoamine oxidase